MTDELLQPSVTNPTDKRDRPWRVKSQVWVAFFGGILAVTVIALINARRLGIDKSKRWLMAAAGCVALAILGALWFREPLAPDFITFTRGARDIRIYGRILAVVTFLILAALQKRAESHYLVFADGEHAPLWTAGIAATLILGSLQTIGLALLVWTLRR